MIHFLSLWQRRTAWQHALLLMVGGALATTALAPFFLSSLLWMSIPMLCLVVRHAARPSSAFWSGWWWGLGYSLFSIYWITHALLVDAEAFGWLIPFALLGIGGALALYHGLIAFASYYVRHLPIVPYCLSFALIWTVAEIARSVLFTGFPWNLIGYSAASNNVSMQLASIGGIFWLSLLVVTCATLPLWWIMHQRRATLIAIGIFILAHGYGAWRLYTHPTVYEPHVRLRLVQAAIPQNLKWSPSGRYDAIDAHVMLSLSKGYKTITHILWPESAMTFRFSEGDLWANRLARIAPQRGSLITGVVRAIAPTSPNDPPILYNSLQSITRQGTIDAVYDKRHLVPFGEYIPLRSILPLTKITHGSIDFSTGDSDAPLTTYGAPPMRPLICYEAIFPWLSDNAHPAWIANLTNDGWFGESTAPYQHLHMARMRAVEQGVALARAANTGISAVIDPYGRILASLELGARGVLDHNLPKATPSPTFYSRFGYSALILSCIVYGIIIALYHPRKFFIHK